MERTYFPKVTSSIVYESKNNTYDEFLYQTCPDEIDLDRKLDIRGYKKYVNTRFEGNTIDKFPFLAIFADKYGGIDLVYVNEYFGYEMFKTNYLGISSVVPSYGDCRHYIINKIINEYYRKQKRIIENFLKICI